MIRRRNQLGFANNWLIVAIFLIVAVAATGTATVVAMLNYFDEKATVNTQVSTAVADAKKALGDKLEAEFTARDNSLEREFAGPDDYGRLSFNYPKTWSEYVAKDGTSNGDTFEAYFNPVSVPPVSEKVQYALRVTIQQTDYDNVISSYSSLVKDGKLTSSSAKVNGTIATRFDGNFTPDIRGSAVVFKIRDKTVTLRTDADTFKTYFDSLVSTIKFNS